MKAIVPNLFRTGGIVDAEAVNANLRQMSADVGRNLSRRYTYSQTIVPLSGLANTDPEAERTIFFRLPLTTPIDLVAVEAVIYSASGATWTITVTNGAVTDSFTVATAGATTKATGGLSRLFSMQQAGVQTPPWFPSGIYGYRFIAAASSASTITSGYLVLHFRADRANGSNHDGYSPRLLQATTSSAGSTLDSELTSFAAAEARDTNNDFDARVECFVARNFFTTQTWNIPSGALRTATQVSPCAIVSTAGHQVQFNATSGTTTLTATGTSGVVFGSLTPSSRTDDPTDSTDDTVVTLVPAGTVRLAYMFLIWGGT